MIYLFHILILSCVYINSSKCENEFSYAENLIETNKCKIPDIPPFAPELDTFVRHTPKPCTSLNPLLSYTTVDNGVPWLHIRNEVAERYFGSPDNITCCYSYVLRKGTQLLPDEGVAVTYCSKFQDKVQLKNDLVWVSCDYSDGYRSPIHGFPATPIYENIHQAVRLTRNVEEKTEALKSRSSKKPISVLMVVIDSVSRLNFIRTMPETRNFVMENKFFEFKGYNKVDDNTFPNAMALLTGMNLNDSRRICKPTDVDGLMNCPFIWYNYRDVGYATAYAEDWSQIATFNYFKKGFKNNPTDYYFKPYMDAITYLKTIYQDTMPFCAGPESQGERVLNLAYDFATTLKDRPNFGVFWMNTFSHNMIHTPSTMDVQVRRFFENLKFSGVLNESIVILLSDHGIRFGEITNTTRGFYELRLPMNYISLPDWFKKTYPEETKHFKENTEKLTSNYDLYMTLQHLLELSGTNYISSPSLACPSCRSLLDNIPTERSCSDAGIPEKWCTCNINMTSGKQQ